MDAHPNPRNRADPELILSTPSPEPSAAARILTTDSASPFEPLCSASGSRNRALHSKKNTVLLCDWWLLWAPEAHEGRRLGVGGVVAERYKGPCRHEGDRSGSKFLLSPWQKAGRVFKSTPITKRYDSFTLGTADGITVRIQGVVNKACSHQNDIPPEVWNLFLTGFPYNWDKYAGACFEGKYTAASVPESAASANEISKGLANPEGCPFPVFLDDLSMRRIYDGSADDSLTRKFRDFLGRFCYTTKPSASDLPPASILHPAKNPNHQSKRGKEEESPISDLPPVSILHPTKNPNHQSKRGKEESPLSDLPPASILHPTKNPNHQSKQGKEEESPLSIHRAHKKGSSAKTIWRPSYDTRYPLTRDTTKKLCIASPESLNLKRSRSGRLLIPPVAEWCQKIIYAANGEVVGITGEGRENLACTDMSYFGPSICREPVGTSQKK